MTTEEAAKIVGRRAPWEIEVIQKALSLHSWLNTPAEQQRLEACEVLLGINRHQRQHEE